MNVTIPLYIEEQPQPDSRIPSYFVRPLFFYAPNVRDENLSRAITKLAKDLRRHLDELGKQMRHDELAAYCFAPDVKEHALKLTLELSKQRVQCRFLFLQLESFGQRIVFSPNLPGFSFEYGRGEKLQDRATEAVTEYFRQRDRKGGQYIPEPEDIALKGKAWTSTLELDIYPPQIAKPPVTNFFALLGTTTQMDGAAELRRVGRCLDWLFPDDLNRAACRDEEVAELRRLLTAKDKRPVLLVGPHSTGKTAIIEEFVYQKVEGQRKKHAMKNNVWLLSPQRLISGMSYVGQWENRLLAILKEATVRDHVLYFDDLLGLYQAGISANADLSVAQVLKPYVERQEFRLLAEITPEAFRVLQERDRGFADMFQVLLVKEPREDDTWQILLTLLKRLEDQYRCLFDLDVLPTALDLQRRYVRDQAFPGKAAAFLRQLAIKFRDQEITRKDALAAFQAKSGMSVSFLDPEQKLERADVLQALRDKIIGQQAALEAAADVITVAKARLNDPDRPLASFLFLGPTGVGKTQCAKAMAEYLFGEAEKMIRFDMNEYISPDAVARLVGTFSQPEGLLTSAIRRQPFALILLDEIEKAHPDVFDLLLQVMGDGRLTDALGRTADFTNAIIILTSNLGVRQASRELGFAKDDGAQTSTYLQAAEKFFRPEFFNRLDRVVPFDRLSREEVAKIAEQLMQGVFAREGLLRRRCFLRVDDAALNRIIDEGYHPTLGARALKRAIERHLTQPVAAQLTPLASTAPTVIEVFPQPQGFGVHVQPLVQAERQSDVMDVIEQEDPAWILEGVEEFLLRAEEETIALRPVGDVSLEAIAPEHRRYFALNEQLRRLQRATGRLAGLIRSPKRPPKVSAGVVQKPDALHVLTRAGAIADAMKQRWADLLSAQDIHAELQDLLAQPASTPNALQAQALDVLCETAWMNFLLEEEDEDAPPRTLLCVDPPPYIRMPEPQRLMEDLLSKYQGLFLDRFGFAGEWLEQRMPSPVEINLTRLGLVIKGHRALTLAQLDVGTHLMDTYGGEPRLVQVTAFPLSAEASPLEVWRSQGATRAAWRDRFAAGQAHLHDNPARVGPVLRIYKVDERTFDNVIVDVRSGIVLKKDWLESRDLRRLFLALLPLPEEI